MTGTLRATSTGRHRRAVAHAAALAAVVSVTLAGCAVPGGPDRQLAGPPAAAPSTGAGTADPAEAVPLGTSTRPLTPTPTPPPHSPTPSRPPAKATVPPEPTPKPPAPSPTPPAPASPSPGTASAEPPPRPFADTGSEASGRRSQDGTTTLRIGTWSAQVVRGGQEAVDACRNAVQWTGPDLGTEDGYALRTAVVVGHDYCGFEQFGRLPLGTVVTATTPRGTFQYRVYATYVSPGRGTPSHGLYWGDLTLQSCVGPDTGFSYLMRV